MGRHRHSGDVSAEMPDATEVLGPSVSQVPFSEVPAAPENPELELLRRDLAEKESELVRLRTELLARDEAKAPLPNSGPGKYRVINRHSPARLKKWEGEASGEQDAWNKYLQAALTKAVNPKDEAKRELKSVEQFIRDGAAAGFMRTIAKVA